MTEVESAGTITDRYETRFGIRTLRFDADQGFFLNGKPVKIKGTCNHQDHAGVGVALPDAMQYFRVRKLQEMGCNALRTSHNPPTPELLDACDELGMLVLDETRMLSSNPEGARAVREHGAARPQPSERLRLVDGQRGEHLDDRDRAQDPHVDEAGRPETRRLAADHRSRRRPPATTWDVAAWSCAT